MSFTPRIPFGRVLLLAAVGTCPLTAHAGEGFYLGLEGGVNLLDDQNLQGYGFGGLLGGILGGVDDGTHVGQAEFSTGWLGGLTTGYSFASGLRPELAITHRRNSIQRLKLISTGLLQPAIDTTDVSGYEMADTAMFNLWYDLGSVGSIRPYIGGGAGAARLAVRDGRYDSNDLNNDSDTVFAWQAGAGFSFDFTQHLTASLDYRFLQTSKANFSLLTDESTHLRTRYRANAIQFGLRYSFGEKEAPPPAPVEQQVAVVPPVEPPPPPPPPPCEAPTEGQPLHLEGCKVGDTIVLRGVNFEFDKANLTLNAKTLLDQVADALQQRPDIKVELDGYTDSKGSDAYNQKLSEQRAAAVKDYLVTRGIDAGRMTTQGFGEAMPVADNDTDEGREHNRRVELKVTESAGDVSTEPAGMSGTEAPDAAPADMMAPEDSMGGMPADGGQAVEPLPETDNAVEPLPETDTPDDTAVPSETPVPDPVGAQ